MFAAGFIAMSLAGACPDAAAPRCYLVLFSGQADRLRIHTAHTWATFVRVHGEQRETFTISWLPCEMPVKPFASSKPGRNYGLHETLDIFRSGRERVNVWGPYEIRPSFYDEAAAYKAVLDSGSVRFITFDGGPLLRKGPTRRPELAHCVHAVTRCNPELQEACNPIVTWGALVTRKVANRMDDVGFFIEPIIMHEWLLDTLDVQHYSLTRRTLHESLLERFNAIRQ